MPTNYGGFREKVKGVAVRKTIETPEEVKGLPSTGDIDPGEIPSLQDLGLNPTPTILQLMRHTIWLRMANVSQVLLLWVVRLKHWRDRRNLLPNVVPNHIKRILGITYMVLVSRPKSHHG